MASQVTHPNPPSTAYMQNIPLEMLHKIVGMLMGGGLYGSAVNLARTSKHFHSRVIPEVYKFTIEKKTFFIAHWAAEHGRMSTLQRAIEFGADINEPFTSFLPFHSQHVNPTIAKRRTNYYKLQTATLHGEELELAVQKRCGYMRGCNERPVAGRWYYEEAGVYKAIGGSKMLRLFKYYIRREVSVIDPRFAELATAPETKRMFLDAFAYWATPLHIAVCATNLGIIEGLISIYGANLNAGGYGICRCTWSRLNDARKTYTFSPLHQVSCQGDKIFLHLLLIGNGALNLRHAKRLNGARFELQQLVDPILDERQRRSVLSETLRNDLRSLWGDVKASKLHELMRESCVLP
ncbi:hypothetical protein N0V82_006744 [Gnomoniopsis sp. IMI 355080]|nr:hypothetical protein N0V82_006744 [Gnomoniopsis sp. IMI 355080]